jgi:hypothetical protein
MSLNKKLSTLLVLLPSLAPAVSPANAQTTYTFLTFTVPNSTYTGPVGITESGDVTGFYGVPPSGLQGGFLRTASGMITTLSYPGATSTGAGGMNKFGVIAGGYVAGSTVGGFFYRDGSYKNVVVNGQPAQVGDINDYGYYTGAYGGLQNFTGFVASPTGHVTILQYPGGYFTSPGWTKNNGTVIGIYQDQFATPHTFVWNARSGYKTIAIPGVPGAQIGDINSIGVIVGGYFNGVTIRGFVYQKGKFQIVEPPGANDSSIAAINNTGQLVGSYTTPGSSYIGYIATPVP